MDFELLLLYYGVVAGGLIIYLINRDKSLTISDFIVAGVTILFSLAGVFISYGIPFGQIDLDLNLYFQYMLFALLVPIGLLAGKKIHHNTTKIYSRSVNDGLLMFMMVIVVVYALGFFFIIRGNIPLVMLLKGESTAKYRVARLQVTHNFTNYYNTYFIYSYSDMIFRYVSLYLFSVLFVKYLNNPKKYKLWFFLYAVFEVFLQFYATEKAPLIYLSMIVIFDIYMCKIRGSLDVYRAEIDQIQDLRIKKKTQRRLTRFIILAGVGFIMLYTVFMGIEDIHNGLLSFASRAFVSQSSAVYLMKKTLDSAYGGSLHGRGIPLTLIDNIFHRNTINLSKNVYESIYRNYTALGGAGTAGTNAFFDIYSNFGFIIAAFVVFLVSVVIGYIDKKSVNTIIMSENKEIPVALGSMLLVVFFQGYLGHFQTFLSLPFIISPQVFIIIVLTWILNNVRLSARGLK